MSRTVLDDALGRVLARDGGRPFVTYYDDRTGERVELSMVTLANWVAKTANLLVDGLGLGPGDTLHLDLPRHWQLPVWALGAWSAGLSVDLDGDPALAQVAVCGPDGVQAAMAAGDAVALSLRPLGAPFPPGVLPPGVVDYGREVAGYSDAFAGPGLAPAAPALRWGAGAWTMAEALAQGADLAARWGLATGGRLLVSPALANPQELLASTLVPLAVQGSVVLCSPPAPGPVGPDRLLRATSERTSALAGP